MMPDCGTLRRLRAGLYLFVIALSSGAPIATVDAQEEPASDTRALRPTVMRPKVAPAGVPNIRMALPRPFVLHIGGGYVGLKLSGTDLARVTAAQVVDSEGREARGFRTRIASRNRTDDRLMVSVIAGQGASPGTYSLQLTYQLDAPRAAGRTPGPGSKTPLRTVVLPASTVAVQARAMTPRIASLTPDPQRQGLEYLGIRAAIADLPGNELVSVTRWTSRNDMRYCDYKGTYHSPEESLTNTWRGAHELEVLFSPGRFVPRGNPDTCQLRFSIRTRNELGEEFYSLLDWMVTLEPAPPDPRRAYPLNDTRQLKKYLAFDEEPYSLIGMCSGTSPGTSGLIPVGLVEVGGDIGLRIRSGPIGTKCTWMVYATGLRSGWELRMKFDKQQVGSKCNSGVETSAAGTFRFDRMASLYHRDGELTLTVNNPNGEIPPGSSLEAASHSLRYIHLSCAPTLTNDHGVFMRMVSAELYGDGGPNCNWKCGVVD